MNKEKGIIIGIVTMLTLILMLSISVYAEDLSNGGATIDFLDDSNDVLAGDYKIDSKVIAVDSDGYTFSKVKIQTLGEETTCTKTQSVTNETTGIKETVCLEYTTAPKVIKEEYFVAELSFNYCKEGQWYRIYKADGYYTTQEDVINNGYKYKDVQCSDNKLRFYVDSFSSYTQLEIDALQAGINVHYSFDDGEYSGTNLYDISGNTNNGTIAGDTTKGNLGIAGESFFFDGDSDYISVPKNFSSVVDNDYTISLWVKAGVQSETKMLYSFYGERKTRGYVGTDGKLYFQTETGTLSSSAGAFSFDSLWHHVVFTQSSSNGKEIWVDNVSVISNSDTVSNLVQTGTYNAIGMGASLGTFDILGYIDEYSVYDRVLNDTEISSIYDINAQGYNIYNYPLGNAPITFTFEGQDPVDLNLSNAPDGVKINYTIEGYNATAMTPYLNYTLLSSNDNCIIYVNGVCQLENGTYIQTEAETNTSTLFQFEADKDNFLSGVFNYNQTEMQNTPKLFYNTSTPNSYIRVDFDNLTNTCARSNLAGYFNSTSAVNRNVYYCNDNYSTGNPKLDANCELVGLFNSINETQRVQNLSYYDVAELSFCGDNLSIGFSSSGSFMIGDGAVLSRHAYINTSAVNSYYTSTSGNTWTQLAGTWDIHFHHWDSDLNFTYYACGIGEDGGFNCSSTVYDTLDVGDSPQLPPVLVILSPESGTEYYQNQSVLINWTSLDINNDNITYTLTINAVDILTDTELEQYTLNLSSYLGTVTIMITADDGTDTDTETVQISVSAVPTDPVVGQFNVGECPVDTTPLSILFLTICFVLTAFVVISYVLNSPFMMFGTGLGILICSWFIVGCVGGLGWTFIILGVGTLLYSMIGIKY